VTVAALLGSAPTRAQKARPPVEPPAPKPAPGTDEIDLTASSANVSEPGSPVKIQILRWSTDEERAPVVAALSPPTPAPAAVAATAGPAGGNDPPPPAEAGDRGGNARGGRGAAGAAGLGRGGAAGRAGRGGAGRGGRGGAGGPSTPIAALTAAIESAATIGYIWTTGITGYSIKYAWHVSLPDREERIILATNRRLGGDSPAWKPVAAGPAADYAFTLIEIHLDAKGMGEGKTSITTPVIVDKDAQTVALDNYLATPALLQNVKR